MLALLMLIFVIAVLTPKISAVIDRLISKIAKKDKSIDFNDDGNIYIDGDLLEEDYGKEVIEDPGLAKDEITLGDDEYFVLGDNRNNSSDSRDPDVGPVSKSQIKGTAWLRLTPNFGLLK